MNAFYRHSCVTSGLPRLNPTHHTDGPRPGQRTRSTNFAKTHTSAMWSMCSLEARTRINALGLPYGRKSKDISPPQVALRARDYLRGIVDADGSVGYTSQGFPFVSLTTASTAIATFFRDHARDLTGAERAIKRNARDDIYNVLYTKEAAQALAADLYYPDCLSLQRRQVKTEALAAWTRPAGMRVAPARRRWTPEEDQALLRAGSSAAAADLLGRSEMSCSMRLWRLRNGQVPTPTEQ
ncbi:LAGLIDADG family homing endonuclease [Streptomyces sp. G45]|uniref:LAGLIDADG family homing endonuclease n=1 Tax=Streptomyces sp. G45 TaxID=3406627 RepID=UPI003C1EAF6A